MKRSFLSLILFFFLIDLVIGQEELHWTKQDKFMLEVGAFIPAKTVKLGADGSTPNDEIDFSENFRLTDNEATFFFHFEWKFSKKWKLAAETFGVNNGNTVILEKPIEFEDIVLEPGTSARASIEFDLYRVFVGRTILDKPRHLWGAGLGIHGIQIGAFVEGEVLTSDGDREFAQRRVSALIPLPNIGTWYVYSPHPKWAFGARVDWFGIQIDEFGGGLWNIAPQVKFNFSRHFGLGLDYRILLLDANVDQSSWKGEFEMNFSGPLFSAHANF